MSAVASPVRLLCLWAAVAIVASASAAETGWRRVAQFSGSGPKNTEAFTVRGEWRVRWQARPLKPSMGLYFGADAESPDGELWQMIANHTSPGADITHGRKPGTYRISVNSFNCKWDILVEARPPPPPHLTPTASADEASNPFAAPPPNPNVRTWRATDAAGLIRVVEGEYLFATATHVQVRRVSDGALFAFALDELSPEDREFVARRRT